MTARRRTRTWAAVLAACATAAALFVSLPATVAPTQTARAAAGSDFNAGMIISDALFYDSNAMTAAQVQSFLQQRVPNCAAGGRCLKDYRQNTDSRPADQYCNGYTGRSSETAAQIIDRVARSCGISQRVLLVLLEKEQSLVTSTNPGSWAYTAATGQGCPDTAACNPATAGFFYQVYYAARQYEIYRLNPTWWGYQAGRWNNILYHPNNSLGCGSARVFVENQATAGLYIYTPYTPNRAALNNLYGTGDTCSSYGNRNFWRLYTDWFGSTRTAPLSGLVALDGQTWLISGSDRFRVNTSLLAEYRAALGSPISTSSSALRAFTDRGEATAFIYSQSRDEKSLLQSGSKHRFVNCAQVTQWGGDCARLTRLQPDVYDRIRQGGPVSDFARTEPGGRLYQITGATMWRIANMEHLTALAGGSTPFIGVMPSSATSRYSFPDRIRYAPGLPVATSDSNDMFLPTLTGKLHPITPSLAADLGLKATPTRVHPTWLASFTRTAAVSHFVACGGETFFAAEGGRHRLSSGAPEGFTPTALEGPTCDAIGGPISEVAGPVFVKAAGTSTVFRGLGGSFRLLPEGARRAQEMNDNRANHIFSLTRASVDGLRKGPAYPRSGTTVMIPGMAGKYLVDGARLFSISSAAIGAGGLPGAVTVSADAVRGLGLAGGEVPPIIRCNGIAYAAGNASWSRVDATGGVSPRVLASTACAALRYGAPVVGPLVMTDGARYATATGGGFLPLDSLEAARRATGTSQPRMLTVGSWYLANLPVPTSPVVDGELVSVSGEGGASLVSGTQRFGFAHPGAATDLGAGATRPASRADVANLPRSTELGVLVRCGTQAYLAGQGRLYRMTDQALAGYSIRSLSAAACERLDLQPDPPSRIVVVADRVTGDRFVGTGAGALRPVRNGEVLAPLNNGVEPMPIIVEPGTIQALR
jgi:hypothetical protein